MGRVLWKGLDLLVVEHALGEDPDAFVGHQVGSEAKGFIDWQVDLQTEIGVLATWDSSKTRPHLGHVPVYNIVYTINHWF